MKKRNPIGKRFTLVETLLALAIFSVAAIVLTFSFSSAQRTMLWQRRGMEYPKIADWAVSRILESSPDRDTLEAGGRMTTVGDGLIEWKAEALETGVLDCFRVVFVLSFPRSREDDDVPESYTRLVYAPEWSEPKEREALLKQKQEQFRLRKGRYQ